MRFETAEFPGVKWDEFVAKHTDVLFYYTLWGNVLEKGLSGRPCYMYMHDKDDILCGMPGVILSYFGISMYYSGIPYGGYVGDKQLLSRFKNEFLKRTKKYNIINISPFTPGDEVRFLGNFHAEPEVATRIDLKGRLLEEVQADFEPSVRQSMNKGARFGLEVVRSYEQEIFLRAYGLYLETMRRNGAIARYPKKWFLALYEVLAKQGLAFAYAVRYQGEIISATVVVESGNGYHLLHSGSSTKTLSLRANDFIVCKILEDCINNGKEYLDFLQTNPADKSLVRWKSKFGGKQVALFKYVRANSMIKYFIWLKLKKFMQYSCNNYLLNSSRR